jgi:tRNA (guanine-N7-)-methyltransferase
VVQPTFTELMAADLPLQRALERDFFKREAPLVLELGCGGGEYTVGLAHGCYPERNFIGVDIKGARIWRGAKRPKKKAWPTWASCARMWTTSCAASGPRGG